MIRESGSQVLRSGPFVGEGALLQGGGVQGFMSGAGFLECKGGSES